MRRILAISGVMAALMAPAPSPALADEACVSVADARVILETQGSRVEHFNAQGVAVLALAYKRIYGERLRAADEALVLDLGPARIPLVHVVLFRDACAVGEGSIPKEIYLSMVGGPVA